MYEAAKRDFANGLHDFDTHTFRIGLFLSGGNAGDLTLANAYLADLTSQHANGNGYTTLAEGAGKSVTLTTAQASGTVTIDETTNPSWTASGGPITARYAVIVNDSHASNQAVFVCLLDTAPADVTATDGNTFTITINASGVVTMSGAAVD